MCRAHGVGFDIRDKQGSIFTLLECDRHENLGMITISDTLQNCLSNFAYNLNAINQEITTATMQGRNNFTVLNEKKIETDCLFVFSWRLMILKIFWVLHKKMLQLPR